MRTDIDNYHAIFNLQIKFFSLRANLNADCLCRLVLPQGLRFVTGREMEGNVNATDAKCHPFVITR